MTTSLDLRSWAGRYPETLVRIRKGQHVELPSCRVHPEHGIAYLRQSGRVRAGDVLRDPARGRDWHVAEVRDWPRYSAAKIRPG